VNGGMPPRQGVHVFSAQRARPNCLSRPTALSAKSALIQWPVLLPAQRVLDAANGVLNFALDLVGLSFAFELGIAGDLPSDLFHLA
jgi:hypothetical protein